MVRSRRARLAMSVESGVESALVGPAREAANPGHPPLNDQAAEDVERGQCREKDGSLGPFGRTAEWRSRDRHRRAGIGILAAIAARVCTFAVSVATVPLTLPYLGAERFGMWVTINAIVLMFGFANLGIGLGLMNSIARSEGDGDIVAERAIISIALVVSLGIACVLTVVLAGIFPFVPWASLLNVRSPLAVSEAAPSTAACIAMFLVGLPLSLSGSVWNGLQRTYVAYFFYGLGAILSLACIVLAMVCGMGVPAMVLAASGGPVFANVLSGATLFATRPHLCPSLRLVSRHGVRVVAGMSVAFFLVQVAMAVATSSDTIVLARVIGPTAVSEYSVVSRLFAVPLVLGTALITIFWPAITEARGAGDEAWIARTARRIMQLDLVFIVPLAVVLVLVGPAIAAVMTQGSLSPQSPLFPAFAVATVMIVFASTVTVFLNSGGIVWPTAACWGVMAIANIGLSVWLCSVVGASGVLWATAITEGIMLVPLSLLALSGGIGRTSGALEQEFLPPAARSVMRGRDPL